jgi:hypothetical protein
MSCDHNFHDHDFVEILFPEEFYIIQSDQCDMPGAVNPTYSCVAQSTARTIRVGHFKDTFTEAGSEISFAFTSVRNPSIGGKNYNILFRTVKVDGTIEAVIDVGTYVITNDKIVKGDVLSFTVTP